MFWMLCIWDSASFVATWKQTQIWVSATGQWAALLGGRISRKHDHHLISEVILRTLIQAISTKSRLSPFLNHCGLSMAGKNVMKLLLKRTRFKWDATPDRSRCVVKPLKAKTNQFGFRRSLFWMCLEGERPGHVWHCNCCFHNLTTSSKPVPNSVWPTRL